MFRRRLDLTWPLILILFGLFLLSLRLPRQWEAIARETPLDLHSHSSTRAEYAVTGTSPAPSAEEAFRVVVPSDQVASQGATLQTGEATVSAANEPVPPAPQIPSTVVEQAKQVEIAAAPSEIIEPAAQPALQPPAETKIAAVAVPNDEDAVRILHDAPAASAKNEPAAPQPDALPIDTQSSNLAFRRLPPPDGASADLHTPAVSADKTESARPASPAAAPEPTLAVALPLPLNPLRMNPVRPVVPEPQPAADDGLPPPNNKPVAAQPRPAAPPAKRAAPAPAKSETAEQPSKAIGRAWEEPAFLLAQLEQLKKHPVAEAWSIDVTEGLRKLGPAISIGAPETVGILKRLEMLVQEAPYVAGKTDDETLRKQICEAGHALDRRVTIYQQISKMGGMLAADAPVPSVDPHTLNKCLTDIEQLTADSNEGHAWRKFLLIDSLREWIARRHNNEERMPRDLAQQVLKRLNQMSLNSHQRQFVTTGPVAALNREMLRHTAEAVESNRFLQHLETYERTGLPSDGRVLARDCQYLSVSSGAAQRELGDRVEMYWRNSNMRIAVSAELLNRMMPKRGPEYAAVHDNIQGASVHGNSVTENEIHVRMIPDADHVRMALEVSGQVAASTRSTAGPATFYTDSQSTYLARKPLEFTLRGIRMWPTEVAVDNNSQVRGIETDFDGMPIAGHFARKIAESKLDESKEDADAEVREKIAQKAKERVDQEATAQVAAAAKHLHEELLGPMDSLLLDPMMISAETNEKRFSMRIRLAGPDQLGGHTPRPQAPSDSMASVQIHESLLNNVLARLELDGETFDLAGLNRRLAERLHRFVPKPVDPDQGDVKITFAAKDALHVRCNDGRLELTLGIARLSKGSRKFKDFQVRASYKPAVAGRSIDLYRDGIVQLIGPRMNAGAQLCLRGVFLKIFSDQQAIHMAPDSFVKNAKLDGIVVTQFIIDDGWIGAAIGPQAKVADAAAPAAR